MSEAERPVHSPLGASSAERWMECPGGNVLINTLRLPPGDESEYAKEGTAAHEAAAYCIKNRIEAWEVVDMEFNGYTVSAAMADAIQDYLDYVKPFMDSPHYCEARIAGNFHPLFYGTVDFAAFKDGVLHVVDFKYGQGIAVDVIENRQLQYYAFGLLQGDGLPEFVQMTIVQPRAFHPDGEIRSWRLETEDVVEWGRNELVPAMLAAEVDETLKPGEWCRFCPAKLACPLLHGLFKTAALANPQTLTDLSDEALGRDYGLREAVKIYLKAQDDEMYRRLNAGKIIAEAKLVHKKADRVFKEGAEARLLTEFSANDLYETEMKSPAKIEKLGPRAKTLVAELAYTPDTGLTVAPASDRRAAVKVQTTQEAFGAAIAGLTVTEAAE